MPPFSVNMAELELACLDSVLHAGPCSFKHALQSSHVCCVALSGHNYLHVLSPHVSVCAWVCWEKCCQHGCCCLLLVLTTPYESFHCSYGLNLHLSTQPFSMRLLCGMVLRTVDKPMSHTSIVCRQLRSIF